MTRAFLPLVLAAAVVPVSAGAQTILLGQDQTESVAVEFWHPTFDDGEPGWPSGSLYMTARKDAGTFLAVVGMPVAVLRYPTYTRIANGNMYLGMETRAPARGSSYEAGVIVPMAPSGREGPEIGYSCDTERFEEFLRRSTTVTAAVNYRRVDARGRGIRVRLSPDLLLSYLDAVELFADYGVFAFYEGTRARVLGGVSGHTWITEGSVALKDRTMLDLQVAVAARLGQVSPGLVFRVPLNDAFLNAGVSSVLGFTLEVALSPATS